MADPLLAQSAIDRLQSARSPASTPTTTPNHAAPGVALDPRSASRHHHPRQR